MATKRASKPRAKTGRAKPTKTKAKPASVTRASSRGAAIAEHNRLRALMGLPAVERPITADPALTEANKLQSLAGKKSALDIMDAMYRGEGPVPPTGTIIHWWGQFSADLPAPFALPDGGHGYAEARDLEHATIVFAALRDWVLARETASRKNLKLKATREWAGISARGDAWYRWMLADERQMTVLFKTRSRLTAAEKRARIPKL